MEGLFQEGDVIECLIKMGLSEREAKVYKVLLGVEEITASAVAKFTDVPRTKVYEALNSLIRKGFCKEAPLAVSKQSGQTFMAVHPEIALEGLMHLERQRIEALEHIQGALSRQLTDIYAKSSLRLSGYDFVETLKGRQEIIHRYNTLRSSAKLEILELSTGNYTMTDEEANEEADANEELIKNGVSIKTIYEQEEIDKGMSTYFHKKNAEVGVEARTLPSLPCKLSLFDQKTVMLPLTDPVMDQPNMTVVIIEHPALYAILNEAFQSFWSKARSIEILQ